MEATYEACNDGQHNLLRISGGRPGPHVARVRALPSGLPLGNFNWKHDETCEQKIPAWAEEIAVQLDTDPDTGAWLEEVTLTVVPLEEQAKPTRRKRTPPKVKAEEQSKAAQVEAAEHPEDTDAADVLEAQENEPDEPDVRVPVTEEEKRAEQEKAEFPTSSDLPPDTDIVGTAPERAEKAERAADGPTPPLRTQEEVDDLAGKEASKGRSGKRDA